MQSGRDECWADWTGSVGRWRAVKLRSAEWQGNGQMNVEGRELGRGRRQESEGWQWKRAESRGKRRAVGDTRKLC